MRIASLIVFVLLLVTGSAVATQYIASQANDAPTLGEPLLAVGHARVYPPWAWFAWQDTFGKRAPGIFRNASGIFTLGVFAALGAVGLGALARRKTGASTAHGSSRWATTREIEKAGLLHNEGVVLCQTDDAAYKTTIQKDGRTTIAVRSEGTLVRHDGPEHVLCFAPPRSGKGVGLVVPTLLSWGASVVVYDIKKENWQRTAGWRRTFSHVWRFEPTAPDSVRFNPLLEIRKGQHEVKDAQNVADILVDPSGATDTKDHWQATAHSLLVAAILHVLYAEDDKSLAGVGR